jgi:lysophospholipase L1-like esterase
METHDLRKVGLKVTHPRMRILALLEQRDAQKHQHHMTAEDIYRQLVERAHAHGVRIIGATLTPFAGALPGTPLDDYYAADKDALRQQLNTWLREEAPFDAVIDLDAALRDPADPARMAPAFDSGDHLHPGDAGNRAMAEAVDLAVFGQ